MENALSLLAGAQKVSALRQKSFFPSSIAAVRETPVLAKAGLVVSNFRAWISRGYNRETQADQREGVMHSTGQLGDCQKA